MTPSRHTTCQEHASSWSVCFVLQIWGVCGSPSGATVRESGEEEKRKKKACVLVFPKDRRYRKLKNDVRATGDQVKMVWCFTPEGWRHGWPWQPKGPWGTALTCCCHCQLIGRDCHHSSHEDHQMKATGKHRQKQDSSQKERSHYQRYYSLQWRNV